MNVGDLNGEAVGRRDGGGDGDGFGVAKADG